MNINHYLRSFSFTGLSLLATIGWGQTVIFTSSNLPIVIIDTHGQEIPDEPKITADMGIVYNGVGVRNNVGDPFNGYDGKIGIEIRGSSSQMFPKKQFGIELRDESGDDMDASLLGLPEESDWVLFAPYDDKTLMRDVLAYKIGNDLGHYTPRTRYCEVVINGTYNGVYVLIEKIKRDKNRVDISKLNADEIAGDDLTGGYIIKLDKSDGNSGPGWTSDFSPLNSYGDQHIVFQYEYPDWDKIADEQKAYIQQYFKDFETTLAGDNFADPEEGYRKYIDVDSWVDYLIAEEITKNVDGYRLSTFLYKDKESEDNHLYMGPLWDFNLAFGNANYCNGWTTSGFAVDFNQVCGDDFWQIPFWWHRLFQDPFFQEKVADRWLSLRAGKFQTATLVDFVDSVASALDESQQRNFVRWPVLNTYVWPNYYVGPDFASEVSYLKQWIGNRMAWLDANLAELVTGLEPTPFAEWKFRLSPNPFHDEFNLTGPSDHSMKITTALFDLTGRRCYTADSAVPAGQISFSFHPDLVPGLYLYRITGGGRTLATGRVMKR